MEALNSEQQEVFTTLKNVFPNKKSKYLKRKVAKYEFPIADLLISSILDEDLGNKPEDESSPNSKRRKIASENPNQAEVMKILKEFLPFVDSEFLELKSLELQNQPMEAIEAYVSKVLDDPSKVPNCKDKSKKAVKNQPQNEDQQLPENTPCFECQCCFDDTIPLKDLISCENDHMFCPGCVKRGCETAFGENKTEVECFSGCNSKFSLAIMRKVMDPVIFAKLCQKKQAEELFAAGVEGLAYCPKCGWINVCDPNDMLFRCANLGD